MAEPTIKLNRHKFQLLISKQDLTAKDFFNKMKESYGLKMGYSTFMEMVNNNVSWKLLYAYIIVQMLDTDIDYLFDFEHSY